MAYSWGEIDLNNQIQPKYAAFFNYPSYTSFEHISPDRTSIGFIDWGM